MFDVTTVVAVVVRVSPKRKLLAKAIISSRETPLTLRDVAVTAAVTGGASTTSTGRAVASFSAALFFLFLLTKASTKSTRLAKVSARATTFVRVEGGMVTEV